MILQCTIIQNDKNGVEREPEAFLHMIETAE